MDVETLIPYSNLYTITRCLAFALGPEDRANLALVCKICCAAIRDAEKTKELDDEKRFAVNFGRDVGWSNYFYLLLDTPVREWIMRDARVAVCVSPLLARKMILDGNLQFAARMIDHFSRDNLCRLLEFIPQFSYAHHCPHISSTDYIRTLSLCVRPRDVSFGTFETFCIYPVSCDVLKAITRKFTHENFDEIRAKYEEIATRSMEKGSDLFRTRKILYAFLSAEQRRELLQICKKELAKQMRILGELNDDLRTLTVLGIDNLRRRIACLNFFESEKN